MPMQLGYMLRAVVVSFASVLFCGCRPSDVTSATRPGVTDVDAAGGPSPAGAVAFSRRDHYVYTTRPISREQAVDCGMRWLPESSKNIQLAEFRYRLAWQRWLRFDASPDSCLPLALDLLRSWNRDNPENAVAAELKPINREAQRAFAEKREEPNSVSYRETSSEIPIQWFTPEHIQEGVEGGGGQGNTVKVWVDTRNWTVFYQEGSGSPDAPRMVPPPGLIQRR